MGRAHRDRRRRGGEVDRDQSVRPTEEEIFEATGELIGNISQIPPAYSAIKIDGQRAYDLARAGRHPRWSLGRLWFIPSTFWGGQTATMRGFPGMLRQGNLCTFLWRGIWLRIWALAAM
jgi:hypothetical protein